MKTGSSGSGSLLGMHTGNAAAAAAVRRKSSSGTVNLSFMALGKTAGKILPISESKNAYGEKEREAEAGGE